MTDHQIQEMPDAYNSKNNEAWFITSQSIGTQVSYALAWNETNFHHLSAVSPYQFYLLLEDSRQAVGAVLDMTGDLHWYVTADHRKKGILTRALVQVILPHLSYRRRSQQISINRSDIGEENFTASLGVALKSGFKVQGGIQEKTRLKQGLHKYRQKPLTIRPEGMDFEELAELRKEVNEATAKIWKVQAQLSMRLGTSSTTRELTKIIKRLELYRIVGLEDALYDFIAIQKRRQG